MLCMEKVPVLKSTFSMPYHALIWLNTFMSRLIRVALRAKLRERIGVEVGISHELWTTTTTNRSGHASITTSYAKQCGDGARSLTNGLALSNSPIASYLGILLIESYAPQFGLRNLLNVLWALNQAYAGHQRARIIGTVAVQHGGGGD